MTSRTRNLKANTKKPAPLADTAVWLTVAEAAKLLSASERTVQRNCASGHFTTKKINANGGQQYRILLASLPPEIQQAYFEANVGRSLPPQDGQAATRTVDTNILEPARKTAAEDGTIGRLKVEPVPVIDHAQRSALWDEFQRASAGHQAKAERDFNVLCAYADLKRAGASKGDIIEQLRRQFGKGVSKTNLWALQQRVRGQDRSVWLPMLMPRWKGRTKRAAFSEEAWAWIKDQWGILSKPTLASVYRRAIQLARAKDWQIPSIDAVQARIDALPEWERVLLREGKEALAKLYPAQQRDYTPLSLHQIWCSDGRKADVFCRWENGEISRPIVVAWMDLRSRVCLGWEVGRSESSYLIRLAFKRAAENSHALPEEALVDNGRGFASKLLTGGIPNRYRFKVSEKDVLGVLPRMGVEVRWALPGHGQSKPIESWWRTLAEMDKRSEFQGAYCGNRPYAKPEDFDPKKAVPIELYRRILAEEISAYHARPHRGSGMGRSSPREMYEALLPGVAPKQPTKAQLAMCLLAAESIKLDKRDRSVKVLGNRYWSETLTALPCDRTYTVLFNPEDAKEPIVVCDGTRVLCEAPLVQAVGFSNKAAAKDHAHESGKFRKARVQMVQASQGMARAERWWPGSNVDEENSEILDPPEFPAPKVATLLYPEFAAARRREAIAEEADDLLSDEEVDRLLASARAQLQAGS